MSGCMAHADSGHWKQMCTTCFDRLADTVGAKRCSAVQNPRVLRLARPSRFCACVLARLSPCAAARSEHISVLAVGYNQALTRRTWESRVPGGLAAAERASRLYSPIQLQNRELAAWSTLSYCAQGALGVPELEAREFRSTLGSPTTKSRQLAVNAAAPQPGSIKSALAHSTAGQDGLHQLPACWDGWRAVHGAKRCEPLHWWRPQGQV